MKLEKFPFELSPQLCYDLIKAQENNNEFVLLDLRSPVKYQKGRLAGALNLDYEDDDFDDELEKLDRNKTYLIYCSWSAKSNIVFEMMQDLGFESVYKMQGGINAWHDQDFALVSDE